VADFIKSLDLFVLPCKQDENGDIDGITVVLMEAMLSGVPVISSKLSGIPELVVDNKTGLLIEQNDSVALAEAISKIINDAVLKANLMEQAVVRVKQEFSQIDNAQKLNALFGLNK
jgi:glycosyltransferase involved in cell wall biosynthesis